MSAISVITINYNNKAGLARTIQSVVGQTYREFEFVIIDGGSSDGSVELARSFGNRINILVSEKDRGIYNAQNKGIERASGEYLLFLNSGDFLCDSAVLQKVRAYLDGTDIVYGDMRINWGGGQVSHGCMPDEITIDQLYRDTLWHPVSFIKRALFEKYGNYDEDFRMVADYEFFFRVIIGHNVKTRHIPVEVCEYSADGYSSQRKHKKTELDERKRVQERYLTARQLKNLANLHTAGWRRWLRMATNWFR